jgi:hypothetical protein
VQFLGVSVRGGCLVQDLLPGARLDHADQRDGLYVASAYTYSL